MKIKLAIGNSDREETLNENIQQVNQLLKDRELPEVDASSEEKALVDSAYAQMGIGSLFQQIAVGAAVASMFFADGFSEIFKEDYGPSGFLKILTLGVVAMAVVGVTVWLSKYHVPKMQAAKAVELIIMYRASSPARPEI